MRLFGSIVVFANDVRDDERTIWCHARWGRGGPQHEAHACWGRGGLAVAVHHYCSPTEGRGGPSLTEPRYRGPARGRRDLVVTVDDKGTDDEGHVPPLVSSSSFFFFLKNARGSSHPFFLKNAINL
jgi:hypothetical protein